MPPRILIAADAPAIQTLVQATRSAPFDATRLFDPPPAGTRAIVIGDPAVPALCKLTHYQITSPQQISLFPVGLRTLLTASSGWTSCITDFYPLSASNPAVTAQLLPHLATVLAAIVSKAPANIRATLSARPVYAAFDGANISDADAAALVAQFLVAFPAAGHAGRLIWHGKLSDAAAAVAGSAVVV